MNVGWFYGERENETRREMGESFPPNINNLMFLPRGHRGTNLETRRCGGYCFREMIL